MKIEVNPFQPSQVETVIELFRDVHGDDYPLPAVYNRDFWITQNETDQLFTYVAQKGDQVLGLVS